MLVQESVHAEHPGSARGQTHGGIGSQRNILFCLFLLNQPNLQKTTGSKQ